VLGLLVVALTPARVYSQYVLYGQLLGVAIAVHVAWSLARAMRQGRPDAGVVLVGMACLGGVLAVNLAQVPTDLVPARHHRLRPAGLSCCRQASCCCAASAAR
jgi:hypothetical protein